MIESRIWRVLGIDPTKDEEQLKMAYYEKLKDTNPEDDPEGFKELREAYEEAVRLATAPEEREEEKPEEEKTPVDKWIDRADALYHQLSKRIDVEEWKKLLSDELCVALDTSEEIAERFLAFGMDHPYFTAEAWHLFDTTFSIRDRYQQYLEKFPKDYMDYVVRQIEQDMFINFADFEGADDADYDTFIRAFFALKGANDASDEAEAAKIIADMEDMFIEHPLFDVEKLRHAMMKKDMEKVKRYLERLEEGGYKEGVYITYYMGEACWELERQEEAYTYFQKMDEMAPNHPASMIGKARYLLYAEKYEEAKELCLDMMDLHGESEEIMDILRKSNEALLLIQEEKMKTDPDDYDNIFEVGWCYFQNERMDDCMALLDKVEQSDAYQIKKDPQVIFDYNNLRGRCYLIQEKYQEALQYIDKWRSALEELQDDGTEKTKKKLGRRGFANYATAMCYYETGKADKNSGKEMDKERLERALHFLSRAITYVGEEHPEDALGYKERMAICHIEMGQYEEAIRLCDEVIAQDEGYFPAYVTRQQAKFDSKDAQGVVDDYYNAIEIYPGYEKPYLLAAKVFIVFRQYQDAIGVIERAKEAGVEGLEMELYYLKALRNVTSRGELKEKVFPVLQELEKKMEEERPSVLAEFYLEVTFYYMDINEDKTAYDYVNRAIKENPSDPSYCWTRADILVRMGSAVEALEQYRSIGKYYKDNADYMYDTGMCCVEVERQGRNTGDRSAEDYFLEAVKLNPKHSRAYHELMEIYQNRYEETHKRLDYKKAVQYATKQLENEKSRYYYLCRAFVYYDGYELDKALEDFKEGIRLEPEGVYSYNGAGLIYFLQNRYEEAKEMYIKAIACIQEGETYAPYRNLIDNLLSMGAYKEAEEWAEEFVKHFPAEIQAFERQADVYLREKKYKEAVNTYRLVMDILQKRYARADKNSRQAESIRNQLAEALGNIADVYWTAEDIKNAERYHKKALKEYSSSLTAIYNAANFYFDIGNYRKALSYYKKGLNAVTPEHYRHIDFLRGMVKTYGANRDKKKSGLYFDKVIDYLNSKYGSVEDYVAYPPYQASRCYIMGITCYYAGRYEEAKGYFQRMQSITKCRMCTYGECYEALIGQALMAEMEGRIAEARLLHEKALAIEPDMAISRQKLKELK